MLTRSLIKGKSAAVRCLPRILNLNNNKNVAVQIYRFEHAPSSNELLLDDAKILNELPEAPPILDEVAFDLQQKVLGDTLAYHGLDWFTPPGLLRMGLCYLHDSLSLPWISVIILGTAMGRACLLPSNIYSLRYSDRMKLVQPEMNKLMLRLKEAKRAGDSMDYQMTQFRLINLQRKNGVGMLGPIKVMLPTAIYFTSFFIAIKRMASAPMESMKSEGILWFTDLTATDPTWVLSVLVAGSFALVMRSQMEFALPMNSAVLKRMAQVGLPIATLFASHFFSTSILVYWIFSNLISVTISTACRHPMIRKKLKLSPLPSNSNTIADRLRSVRHFSPFDSLNAIKKYFKDIVSKRPPPSSDKIRSNDDDAFRRAGRSAVVATYDYNPKERFPELFKEKSSKSWFTFKK